MFRIFSENFKSIRSAVQEKITFEHFERSELTSEHSDRAVIARFHMRAWSDDSVRISARSTQLFRRKSFSSIFERSELTSEHSDRAQIALFQLPVYRHHSVKISAQSIQPFRKSLHGRKKKKKQESTIKAYNLPAVSASRRPAALRATAGRFKLITRIYTLLVTKGH